MRSLWAKGFGRLHCDAEIITDDRGKTVLLATVEFEDRRLHTGKMYAQRVTFRSFHESDIARVGELRQGVYLVFDGDCDALAEKSSTGWWYANPRVTGRIIEVCDYAEPPLPYCGDSEGAT